MIGADLHSETHQSRENMLADFKGIRVLKSHSLTGNQTREILATDHQGTHASLFESFEYIGPKAGRLWAHPEHGRTNGRLETVFTIVTSALP